MAKYDIVLLKEDERIALVWAGRLRGRSYEEIFLELNNKFPGKLPLDYSVKSVQKDVNAALERLRPAYLETASDMVKIEALRFDTMLDAIWDKAISGDTRAIDTALAISRERRKLLGLDESEKITVDFRVTLAQLLQSGKVTPAEIQSEFGDEVLTEVNYKLLEMK